jgi:hypothetical protein
MVLLNHVSTIWGELQFWLLVLVTGLWSLVPCRWSIVIGGQVALRCDAGYSSLDTR